MATVKERMLTHNELSRVWFFFVNIYVEISSHNSVWIVSLKCLNVSQGSRHLSVRHFRQIRTYRLKRAVAYENLPSKQMRCSCVGARLALHTIKLEPQLSKMWNGRINRSQDDAFFQSRGSMNYFIYERVMSLPLGGGHFLSVSEHTFS